MAKRPYRPRIPDIIGALLCLPVLAFSQETSKTTAPCSPIAPYNSGVIQIQCSVRSEKVGTQLIEILNRIQSNQLDPKAVMDKLEEIAKGVSTIQKQVNPNAPKVTYDFNGVQHIQEGGEFQAGAGEQFSKFREMLALDRAGKWEDLRKVADSQIESTPAWLTPYLFKADAERMLGNKAEAIADSGARRARFRNHPGQHSEMKPGTIPG